MVRSCQASPSSFSPRCRWFRSPSREKALDAAVSQAAPNGALRLPQVEPTRLYRQIAALIGERIDDGLFPVGTLLPAERNLAQQLGVSRTSVREALIALEVSGKVSIRVGHGVQILPATPQRGRAEPARMRVTPASARSNSWKRAAMFEPRSAALAAAKRQPDDLDAARSDPW